MKKTSILFITLTIVWMILIFCFSNQPSDESKNTSSDVTRKIVNIIYQDTLSEQEKELKIEKIDPIIRKLAHYTIYTIGGIIIGLTITTFEIQTKKKILITQAIGSIYAITDEIHQYFIPGRSCQIKDILIDSFRSVYRYNNNIAFT